MTLRRLLALFTLAALAACASAHPTAATTTPSGTAMSMRPYYMAVLRRGPHFTSADTPQRKKLLEEHLNNLHRLSSEGKLVVGGPVDVRPSSPRDAIVGIFILDVPTQAEAEALVMTDPGVAAGHFTAEVVTWFGPKGLTYDGRAKTAN